MSQNYSIDLINLIHKVYDTLGRGHSEDLYHKALSVALTHYGVSHNFKPKLPITFMGSYVGFVEPDIVITDGQLERVIEVKALCSKMGEKEQNQLRMYKKYLGISKGMLINFGQSEKVGLETHTDDLAS